MAKGKGKTRLKMKVIGSHRPLWPEKLKAQVSIFQWREHRNFIRLKVFPSLDSFSVFSQSISASTWSNGRLIDPPLPLPLHVLLPWEVVGHIVSFLDNYTIKNLRLTCRLYGTFKLRIDRVFISPNSADIETFYAIVKSEVYRPDIIEVVYDHAFVHFMPSYNGRVYDFEKFGSREINPVWAWFEFEVYDNANEMGRRYGSDVGNRPERIEKAWRARGNHTSMKCANEFLGDLEREQDGNIEGENDATAFRWALRLFPALRTITVTPATHGFLYTPLYETPLIRQIPLGMNYPLPRGWPTRRSNNPALSAAPWEEEKYVWYGLNMVTKILVEEKQHHHVSELLIDAHTLHTGLSCRLFEETCEEYSNFQAILQQPGFKKLQLSLHIHGQELPAINWAAFRSRLLRDAIAEASQLEYFSMETNWDMDMVDRSVQAPRLPTFLPIECWEGLQHFRLWNFPLRTADLISTLSQLTGLRCLELGFLDLYEDDNHHDLLNNMRDILRLHERPMRPKVKLAMPIPDPLGKSCANYIRGRAIWLDEQVEQFLYRKGVNLFVPGEDKLTHPMGIVKDAFDPEYKRPYVPRSQNELEYHNPVRFLWG